MAEEEDVECQLPALREACGEEHCGKYKTLLEACNDRVNGNPETEEKCHEEMIDFMHCVDHCAMPKLFAKHLK